MLPSCTCSWISPITVGRASSTISVNTRYQVSCTTVRPRSWPSPPAIARHRVSNTNTKITSSTPRVSSAAG